MIIDLLKTTLANSIESAFIVQGYHWNVEGPDFNQYHGFFGEIYTEYFDQVDILAEYVRIVSKSVEYINSTSDITKINKTVKSNSIVGNKPIEMCKAIAVLNAELLDNFKNIFKQASNISEDGLANYAADRIDYHSKLHWKLVAVTK